MPAIFTTKGALTAYGLACGYVERRYSGTVCVTLWREHGTYHVRGVHCRGDRRGERAFWQSFGKLAEARREFFKPVRQK